MMRSKEWTRIWRQRDVDELYNVGDDPNEQVNLLAAPLSPEKEQIKTNLANSLQ
jgi:hypothetical protein